MQINSPTHTRTHLPRNTDEICMYASLYEKNENCLALQITKHTPHKLRTQKEVQVPRVVEVKMSKFNI